ncbi:Hypothetical predicted protein [Paramuricea clavata]|uniref:Uncharacterized protein n=1 Tax=Paramuricea clavata TaxID=317549 RepID=A0A7D9E5F4_PARCT|nr:Hypothetical predicted protein [Paramuricea clavata]
MSEEKLREYSQRLFDILSAPYIKKFIWKEIRDTIAILANSMSNYCMYLRSQAKRVKENRSSMVVKNDRYLKVIEKWEEEIEIYRDVVRVLMEKELWKCIFLDEYSPTDRKEVYVCHKPEAANESPDDRRNQIDDSLTVEEAINKAHDVATQIHQDIKKFHSRAMRREFVQLFGLVANKAVLRYAYRTLTGDCSAAETLQEAEVDRRLEQVVDEQDPDLLWDCRHCNQGRPLEYDDFLNKCRETISASIETAVDD